MSGRVISQRILSCQGAGPRWMRWPTCWESRKCLRTGRRKLSASQACGLRAIVSPSKVAHGCARRARPCDTVSGGKEVETALPRATGRARPLWSVLESVFRAEPPSASAFNVAVGMSANRSCSAQRAASTRAGSTVAHPSALGGATVQIVSPRWYTQCGRIRTSAVGGPTPGYYNSSPQGQGAFCVAAAGRDR